jgi:hypothetical protein
MRRGDDLAAQRESEASKAAARPIQRTARTARLRNELSAGSCFHTVSRPFGSENIILCQTCQTELADPLVHHSNATAGACGSPRWPKQHYVKLHNVNLARRWLFAEIPREYSVQYPRLRSYLHVATRSYRRAAWRHFLPPPMTAKKR